ncbi:hypothetical protein BKA67DRAFT_551696 [Truncatella angustata]|uniref:Trafficking protein particle complex subunit 13 n=1 Tax=Truncatella angustata TaxID=152316 RepID=A0A9P8UQG6_9PEZI|nr:uncharacterized protein BKA67DRAFT_551696 [Truncatella angustata]KAH6656349.1 hypothetical protein BKA67DRAFT_551696 [Truncatella angustata]KAH8194542.1 hypothetical protein TruAng_011291 [Truncatella angustata]
MSHQRYPSIDPVKEPHSVSLKVLRLSRPSLVTQHPLTNPTPSPSTTSISDRAQQTIPASLAYKSTNGSTNPDPFLLTPILNLPPSFGSAYVGETFSCTLCANHEVSPEGSAAAAGGGPLYTSTNLQPGVVGGPGRADTTHATPDSQQQQNNSNNNKKKWIRDVRIEAEMKTPSSSSAAQKLRLGSSSSVGGQGQEEEGTEDDETKGTDLDPGKTLQRIVNFDLKEEGNHVLAVTVSYYEATETSGRTRTFRKLYQFICKGSLIVRTKVGALPPARRRKKVQDNDEEDKENRAATDDGDEKDKAGASGGRWVLEAQLENCSEDVIQLDRIQLNLEPDSGMRYRDANWRVSGSAKPVLHPGEVEQVCFVVEEDSSASQRPKIDEKDGRIVFGVLGIGWRTEMGNRGFLSTGKLGARVPGV